MDIDTNFAAIQHFNARELIKHYEKKIKTKKHPLGTILTINNRNGDTQLRGSHLGYSFDCKRSLSRALNVSSDGLEGRFGASANVAPTYFSSFLDGGTGGNFKIDGLPSINFSGEFKRSKRSTVRVKKDLVLPSIGKSCLISPVSRNFI